MTSKLKAPVKFSDVFPVALFVLCWGWLIWLTYYTSGHILDADASNVLVLSNFLSQQNAIVSTGWRYYTEIHVFNMPLVYSFFFHIFKSWQLVRFFGTVTLQAMLVLSYWWLCRQAKISRNAFFYSATVLLLPASVTYARIVLLHGHYAFHISLAFLIIGLILKLATNRPKKNMMNGLLMAVFALLCVVTGMNGMRMLYISLAPAFFITAYLYFRSAGFHKIAISEQKTFKEGFKGLVHSARETAEGRAFLFTILGSGFNAFGIATNIFVLRKFFGFSTYYSLQTISPSADALSEQINDLMNLFGYRNGAKVFSLEGICSLLAVLGIFLAIGFSLWYFFKKSGNEPYSKRFVATIFFGALIIESLVFLITGNYFIHYYTPVYVLIVLLIAVLLDEFPKRSIRMPRICAAVMLFAFVLSGAVTTNFLVNKPEGYATRYEGLSYSNINQVDQIKPAASYLADHGYTYGYAYYWDSSIVTELTDGKVEICAIVEPPDITYSFANTKKAFWDINYHQGKTFLLLEKDDTSWQEYPILEGGTQIYADDYYKIIEYPAPIPFERSPFSE